jgi:TRAP-type C4-dicarboxylate transport system permease large subunit
MMALPRLTWFLTSPVIIILMVRSTSSGFSAEQSATIADDLCAGVGGFWYTSRTFSYSFSPPTRTFWA